MARPNSLTFLGIGRVKERASSDNLDPRSTSLDFEILGRVFIGSGLVGREVFGLGPSLGGDFILDMLAFAQNA
jgi:hypothetical protein